MNATEVKPETVKALEWRETHDHDMWGADSLLGRYRAWTHYEAEGKWFWHLSGVIEGSADSSDAARAACQADYAARILSALVPLALPETGGGFAEGIEAAAKKLDAEVAQIEDLLHGEQPVDEQGGDYGDLMRLLGVLKAKAIEVRALSPTPSRSPETEELIARAETAISLGNRTGARGARPENIYNVAADLLAALRVQPTAGEGWQPADPYFETRVKEFAAAGGGAWCTARSSEAHNRAVQTALVEAGIAFDMSFSPTSGWKIVTPLPAAPGVRL